MTKRKVTDLIFFHVTATKEGQDIGAKEIDAMHKAQGWSGIGYHRVIRLDGKREAGRGIDEIGSHVKNYNSRSVGVTIVGGLDKSGKPKDTRTKEQKEAMLVEAHDLLKRYPDAKFLGHRDVSPDLDKDGVIESHEWIKMCPCFDVIPWAEENGLPGANIRGNWSERARTMPEAQPDKDEARNTYLQTLLARAGFQFGAVDGDIGPKTKAAIKLFQTWHGLDETSEFDKPTVAKLRAMFEH